MQNRRNSSALALEFQFWHAVIDKLQWRKSFVIYKPSKSYQCKWLLSASYLLIMGCKKIVNVNNNLDNFQQSIFPAVENTKPCNMNLHSQQNKLG